MPSKQSDAFFRIGLPMIILVTGGSVFLSSLLQGKYEIKARTDSEPPFRLFSQPTPWVY